MKILDFIRDPTELNAFLIGAAGTGKTTTLKEICEELLTTEYNFQVVAYTHKAKQVLQSKLPEKTPISTLHSFLKKRPGINEKAKHIKTIVTSRQHGRPEPLDLLIIDEYSFVGEKDDISLCELQDELNLTSYICKKCGKEVDEDTISFDGEPFGECKKCGDVGVEELKYKPLKILYVGDPNQLPPIGAPSNLTPSGKYVTKLTKIHRTDNDLLQPLGDLVKMIEGTSKPHYLEETEYFKRKQDIIDLYLNDMDSNKILLAFTNKKVQELNFTIQGASFPCQGNYLFISSLRCVVKVHSYKKKVQYLATPSGMIDTHTKYNPIGYLNKLPYVHYFDVEVITSYNEDYLPGRRLDIACIFGTYENKLIRDKLGKALVKANKKSLDSKAIYREYKTINDYVCVADFNHCMTVHKSQGSEYNNVYLEAEDFKNCIDLVTRLKLLYVGISRAKNSVFLNN